jgi:hypothetical protein
LRFFGGEEERYASISFSTAEKGKLWAGECRSLWAGECASCWWFPGGYRKKGKGNEKINEEKK